jgi:hypothetical protein
MGSPSAATFNAGNSTVVLTNTSSATLAGASTFYALRAVTSGTTLYFTAGTTTYATNMVEFRNVSLLSTTSNATWYFTSTASSQTLRAIQVKDSNASGGLTMPADSTSVNKGNNTNWTFGHVAGTPVASSGNGDWYSATPDAPWPNGYVPLATDTVTISVADIVTATTSVSVASMTIGSSGEMDLDGTGQSMTFTVGAGGQITNNGIMRVINSANSVTLQGAGGAFTFTGTDIDYNANKLYLSQVIYQPSMSLASGETVELSGNATLGPLTTASGAAFIMGNNNVLTLTGNVSMAAGTFTPGTGSAQVKLDGNLSLNTANQNLGNVATGP